MQTTGCLADQGAMLTAAHFPMRVFIFSSDSQDESVNIMPSKEWLTMCECVYIPPLYPHYLSFLLYTDLPHSEAIKLSSTQGQRGNVMPR